jgi:hypothetical protein
MHALLELQIITAVASHNSVLSIVVKSELCVCDEHGSFCERSALLQQTTTLTTHSECIHLIQRQYIYHTQAHIRISCSNRVFMLLLCSA